MGLMRENVPIGDTIGELFIGNRHSIILLALFDLDLDLVILSKVRDLLR